MQSQQKKVKWSRGETADALEERTDTGITQVSASKMENIIADVYGNISRRPALKIIESEAGATDIPVIQGTTHSTSNFTLPPQSFVFTVDTDTYIVFIVDWLVHAFGGLLIRNNKFVKRVKITNNTDWSPLVWDYDHQISVAQYNNFMVVSNLYLGDVIFRLDANNDVVVEKFQFDAPWYAPEGTQSKTVTNADIHGLKFNDDGAGFTAFSWTNEDTGISSPYSLIDTGLDGDVSQIESIIPVGSIVKFPNMSAYMRVEGYNAGGSTIYLPVYTFDDATVGSHTTSGFCVEVVSIDYHGAPGSRTIHKYKLRAYYNGEELETTGYIYSNAVVWVQSSTSASGYEKIKITHTPGVDDTIAWEDVPTGTLDIQMFGPLLTPVANSNGKDTSVTVETGYISLNEYQPKQFTFSGQRLYAAGFYNADMAQKEIPGYAVGSQIGRYNDFNNDYNTQSEAVVIDISTSYQEKIVSLIDYNGLKILTNTAEYAYINGGVVKQSENGALATCKPIVFGSICLYADKSGGQIRAMQYELQTDIFNSSSINQLTQEDLIFNTNTMAGFYDKEYHAGHFLFATQVGYTGIVERTPIADHTIAVCNLVPGNQAMIWGRWTTPDILADDGTIRHTVANVIEVDNKVWFVVGCDYHVDALPIVSSGYTLAELDYSAKLDIEVNANSSDTQYRIIKPVQDYNLYAWVDQNDPTNVVYTKDKNPLQNDNIYDKDGTVLTTATNSPGGPNLVIDGVGYYAWGTSPVIYTKSATPNPTGPYTDESRQVFDGNGDLDTRIYIGGYNSETDELYCYEFNPIVPHTEIYDRIPVGNELEYTYLGISYTADYDSSKDIYAEYATLPGATVSVFDGDQYMWDDTLDANGNYTKSLAELTDARVGFMINATLESHPLDIGGKTYTEKKRIGKAVAVIRNTEPGAFTVCGRTGYTSSDKKLVNFYGCTGMKDQIRYTIKNIQGAKFTIESLTMIIEYGTLDS